MRFLLTISLLFTLATNSLALSEKEIEPLLKSDTLQSDSVRADSLKLASAIEEKAKAILADSISNIPQLDSAKVLNQIKTELSNQLDDSIRADSLAVVSKAKELSDETLKNQGISVEGILTDSTEIADKVESTALEELNEQGINISNIPTDSAAVKSEATSIAWDEISHHTGIEVPEIALDSTTMTQVKDELESRAEEAIKGTDEFQSLGNSELDQLVDMKEEIELSQQELQQIKAKKELKQKMASQAKEFISDHTDEIQQVQEQMGELKQKYSSVLDSNDLSTAKKRSSLEDEPLGKRLTYGANFNISGTDPLTIDFAPTMGYRFNKLFEAGLAGMYRGKFGSNNALNVDSDQIYGYSIYVRHDVYRNFFGYVEGENINQTAGTDELRKRDWQQTLLVGIGRKFKIASILELQTIITYNFLHENKDGVYNNPIVFKTGVRVVR